MNGSPAEENVETECLDCVLTLSATFVFDRNGFKALPIWLRVRPAAPAALWTGAMPGRLRGVAGEGGSSRSSGGVRNGSSGGRCSTTGSEDTVEYERKEGAGACGATLSLESAGSTDILGTCKPRWGEPANELFLERFAPNKTAASADLCCLRNPP